MSCLPNASDDGSGTNPLVCGFVIVTNQWRLCIVSTSRQTRGLPAHSPPRPCDGPAERIHEACLASRNSLGKSISTAVKASHQRLHVLRMDMICKMVFFIERLEADNHL